MPREPELVGQIWKLIDEYQEICQRQEVRSEVVIVIGMTGVGKSTLINYLNGVPLEAFSNDGGRTYKLKVKTSSSPLSGIEIGQSSTTSHTRHPGVYSPQEKSFTYVDMPGFGDTGNVSADKADVTKSAQDIANAYFRKIIAEKAQNFKIVLVVTYNELINREGNLPKSLSDFARFLQGITSDDPKVLDKVKNATSIVVTKIQSMNNSEKINRLKRNIARLEEELRKEYNSQVERDLQAERQELSNLKNNAVSDKNAAKAGLTDFLGSPHLNPKIKKILEHVIGQEDFAVFTTPMQAGDKSPEEAKEISELIEGRTKFISKQDANIGIQVSQEHQAEVINAINGLSEKSKRLGKYIDEDLAGKLRIAFKTYPLPKKEIQTILDKCKQLKGHNSPSTLKSFFDQTHKELSFLDTTVREYEKFNNFSTFLIDLLPAEDRKRYSQKNWIEVLGLKDVLDKQIASAESMLQAPQVEFVDGTLTVRGYEISTSQVDAEIKKHSSIQHIEMYALHTVFINNDLSDSNAKCKGKLHGVNLSIIAPNIEVTGDRIIDLSGQDKSGLALSKAGRGIDGTKGVSGDRSNARHGGNGGHGVDGQPGESGTSAGNLFIVSDRIFKSEHLTVKLNGGSGANGQNGGDGGSGGSGGDIRDDNIAFCMSDGCSKHYDNAFATLGTANGGTGGNAGLGGKGGSAGKGGRGVLAIVEQLTPVIEFLSGENGDQGRDGLAGEPGKGGAAGTSKIHDRKRGGNAGSDGKKFSYINEKGYAPAKRVIKQNFHVALLNYEIFLEREAAKHLAVTGDFLHSFRAKCDNIDARALKTTTHELLEEAGVLEQYNVQYKSSLNFIPFYYSLLRKIKSIVLEGERTPQELKTLEYLYALMLGKVANINAAADNLLIIDIKEYVEILSKDFVNLNELKTTQRKEHYKQQYQAQIRGKLEEAKLFLDKLEQEVSKNQKGIERQIENLKNEVTAERQAGEIRLKALQKSKDELKEALHKKLAFDVIRFTVQSVGMLYPPAGPIVAEAVNQGFDLAISPSFEGAMDFAGKVVAVQSQLNNLPKDKSPQKQGVEDLVKQLREMAPILQGVRDLLNQRQEGDKRLAQLDKEIDAVKAYINGLDIYLKTVPQAVGSYLWEEVDEIKSFQKALENRSLVSLEFSKFEMRQFFDALKQNINVLVGQFRAGDGFAAIAVKMQEAIDISTSICMRIQEYRDHVVFSNYIAHLHTADVQKIDVGSEYQPAIDKLTIYLKQTAVQEAYGRAITAIKQWAFPFGKHFLSASAIPNLEVLDFDTMLRDLPSIQSKLGQYKNTITTMDQVITHNSFDVSLPFFNWPYVQQPQKIEALLKGEKVILRASIRGAKWDAIKFNKIGIKLECSSTEEQTQLDSLLQNFKVSLTHSGISYYQYGGQVYQIVNDKSIDIVYSFKIQADGIPVQRNEVWKKMAGGDILISPYTTWIMQIEPTDGSKKVDLFSKFKSSLSCLNVKLIGEGSYVDTKKVTDELNLEQYYRQVQDFELEEADFSTNNQQFCQTTEQPSFQSERSQERRQADKEPYRPKRELLSFDLENAQISSATRTTPWFTWSTATEVLKQGISIVSYTFDGMSDVFPQWLKFSQPVPCLQTISGSQPSIMDEDEAHHREEESTTSSGSMYLLSNSTFLKPLSVNDYLGVVVPYVSHYVRKYSPITLPWNKMRLLESSERRQLGYYQKELEQLAKNFSFQKTSDVAKGGFLKDKICFIERQLKALDKEIAQMLSSNQTTSSTYRDVGSRTQKVKDFSEALTRHDHTLTQINKKAKTKINRDLKNESMSSTDEVAVCYNVVADRLTHRFLSIEEVLASRENLAFSSYDQGTECQFEAVLFSDPPRLSSLPKAEPVAGKVTDLFSKVAYIT